jgi:hypothetical protein
MPLGPLLNGGLPSPTAHGNLLETNVLTPLMKFGRGLRNAYQDARKNDQKSDQFFSSSFP